MEPCTGCSRSRMGKSWSAVTSPDWAAAPRASIKPALGHNPNLRVSAVVASNHQTVVSKDFHAIADAVREIAAVDSGGR